MYCTQIHTLSSYVMTNDLDQELTSPLSHINSTSTQALSLSYEIDSLSQDVISSMLVYCVSAIHPDCDMSTAIALPLLQLRRTVKCLIPQ